VFSRLQCRWHTPITNMSWASHCEAQGEIQLNSTTFRSLKANTQARMETEVASHHLTSPREPPGGPTAHSPPPASSSAPVHSLPLSRGAVLVLAVVGSRVQSSPAHSSISPARRWVSSPPARAPPVSEAGRPDLSAFKYSRLPGADQLSEDPCL
jgi:hypothetical protein